MSGDLRRWQRVKEVFHSALMRTPGERAELLDRQCGGDADLRREVESLLAAHDAAGSFGEHADGADVASALQPDTVFGSYRIIHKIGSGGMGEVYRARDTRLGRDVALKVLPRNVAGDPDRIARLAREAQLLAALNHPHIATIYQVEENGDSRALVLELVDGPTLADRLRAGPLPLHEALRIAGEIAAALEAAHDRDIVHRDLKPANVKLTASGRAKVLDFGLAKPLAFRALQSEPGLVGTTVEGVVAGTPAYMSPEQTRGHAVDKRTDIWAWGCVVYELLTGRTAFAGATTADTIARIVADEPDWSLLPRTLPRAVRDLLHRCVEKNPDIRLQNAAEARRQIEAATGAPPTGGRPVATMSGRRSAAVGLAIATVAAAATLLAFAYWPPSGALRVEHARQLTFAPEVELDPALSPDGRMIAYASGTSVRTDIYVRQVSGGDAIKLTGDLPEVWHRWPRWSPDGAAIAFVSRGPESSQLALEALAPTSLIRIVPAFGGAARTLVESGLAGHAWSPDGTKLAYVRGREVHVAGRDGTHRRIADAIEPHSPAWSPDGKWIAFASGNPTSVFSFRVLGNLATSAIAIVPAEGGEPRQLTDRLTTNLSPVWMPDSRSILFLSNRGGSRDVFQLRLSGSAEPVGDAVRITTGLNGLSLDLSRDGEQLVYALFLARANLWSIPVPESGPVSAAPAKPVTTGAQMIEGSTISPDGTWIAFDSSLRGNQDIYRIPRSGGRLEQLTSDPRDDFMPAWSPDGRWIAFYSFRNGNRDIYVTSADGTQEQQVTRGAAQERYPHWSSGSDALVFFSDQTGRHEVFVVTRTNGVWGSPRQLTNGGGLFPRWSPDGRRIAYISNGLRLIPAEGGESTLLVAASATFSVTHAAWSRDGETIYFKGAEEPAASLHLWAVSASGGTPRPLVRFDDPLRPSTRPEFASDGKEFLFTISERDSDIWALRLTR
jgi:Tol biopolymer transport system component